MTHQNQLRYLIRTIPSVQTSDGAGVKLRRSIGSQPDLRLDPFLMLDEFGTENPDDYIAGFPPHPHRGFETVTYMIDGHMRHEDHMGNIGELKTGGVQWMTAGKGVIHSEMPQQKSGRMRGFQLWVNLPAKEKMKPASYQDISPENITLRKFDFGELKMIAGEISVAGEPVYGPINSVKKDDSETPSFSDMTTDPIFADVLLQARKLGQFGLPRGHSVFLYVYEGEVIINGQRLRGQCAGILSDGDLVEMEAREGDAKLILVAGKPINEPIVQYGPFVMNTEGEIEQAVSDFRQGILTD